MPSATAIASPNIALIKYWGNRDTHLRLPANGSISMTLGGLETRTRVTFDPSRSSDLILLNGLPAGEAAAARISQHLDRIRDLARLSAHAEVSSQSNFPGSAGIAASAAGFAALTAAGCAAAGLDLSAPQLSRLARLGSGSACRSVYGGFVEWLRGESDADSYAVPLAPADHWDLVDLVAVVSREPKSVASSEGHALAATSPLQPARVADTPRRLLACRQAIVERDFDRLAEVVEHDSLLMHAVMFTSRPALVYWTPATLELLLAIAAWRQQGLPVCATVDAGPNVHCLCPAEAAGDADQRLRLHTSVLEVLPAHPGPAVRLV